MRRTLALGSPYVRAYMSQSAYTYDMPEQGEGEHTIHE